MPTTFIEHLEEQIAEIDAELQAGGPKIITEPTQIRENPDDFFAEIKKAADRAIKRQEEQRAIAEWPARKAELIDRKERLQQQLTRERRRVDESKQ